jgi:hypothetical protein
MHTPHALRVLTARLRLLTLGMVAAGFAVGFAEIGAPAPVAAASPALTAPAPGVELRGGAPASRVSSFDAATWDRGVVARIDSTVFELALKASRCATASGVVDAPATLTIIDYSKASVEPRLWVLDLATREVLYEELVSHGQGSGGNFATKFSNTPDSHQTSIGLFVTDAPYVGRNGYSLRLDGLDRGFNDRARDRAIVMHGAPYVNTTTARSLGRLGRSHGCPAVRDAVARELIDRVKGGSLVFAYYPDAKWLSSSKYLGTCGA